MASLGLSKSAVVGCDSSSKLVEINMAISASVSLVEEWSRVFFNLLSGQGYGSVWHDAVNNLFEREHLVSVLVAVVDDVSSRWATSGLVLGGESDCGGSSNEGKEFHILSLFLIKSDNFDCLK